MYKETLFVLLFFYTLNERRNRFVKLDALNRSRLASEILSFKFWTRKAFLIYFLKRFTKGKIWYENKWTVRYTRE